MKFTYYAKQKNGEDVRGTVEAKDRFEVARLVRQQGYTLVSCKNEKEGVRFSLAFLTSISFGGRVTVAEKMMFSRNLGVMVSAGLPITRAIDVLSRQTRNKKFKQILLSIQGKVQKGNSLSDSMKDYPGTFSSLFTAMVKVGEETGGLSESLELIAEQLERDHQLMKKIKGAMIYPSIVVFAMFIIGIFMFIYVVPTLTSTFIELDVELPVSTRAIIGISDFMISHTLLVILFLAALFFGFISLIKTKIGRDTVDTILVHMPIISPLVKKVNSSRTTRTLSSLLSAGVNIVDALTITQDVLQNRYFKEVLNEAKIKTQKGESLSEAFKKADNLFPLLVGEMMAVGEETGELSKMLKRLSDFYEDEVNEATKDLSTVIEPFLMLIIGGAVGFFAVSMITPMYSMMSGI